MFKYKSCAKLNSFLNVTAKLKNGYHELNTHFQLIDLFDEIEFTENETFSLDSNAELSQHDNSVLNAIDWFNSKFNFNQNFRVSLKKNIPIGYQSSFKCLEKYEIPKDVLVIDNFPETNGKLNRLTIRKLINHN